MHHALQTMESDYHAGSSTALERAKSTFAYYWMPDNLPELAALGNAELVYGIDEWLPRDTYGGMRSRGLKALEDYYDLLTSDDGQLLALELFFEVPIDLEEMGQHTLSGTVDRLAIRRFKSKPYLSIEDFKGIALDTPLPTPNGWTTMGAVQVGEQVLGPDGLPTTVVAASQVKQHDCYRVTFDDMSSIVCDDEHLWQTDQGILDTPTLARQLKDPTTGQRHQRIANAVALELPAANLPIDPYVLGVWLGDGRARGGEVCKPEPFIFQEIERRGWRVGPDTSGPTRAETHTVYGLRTAVRAAGLFGNKHVPDAYLRASHRQRLDLLRGLMDTDGSWHPGRKRAVFTSCDKALAASVAELVVSLGMKATTFEVQRVGFGLNVTAYDVCFSPLDEVPFLLPRKADQVRVGTAISRRRLVVSVEPTVSVPTRCIQVDNASSMYLCGEQMVPTHNTGKQPPWLRYAVQWTVYSYAARHREFWAPWGDQQDERWEAYKDWAHRGTWIDIRLNKRVDAGWRGEQDYARLKVALKEYVKAVEADIYPLTLTGETCTYCPHRRTCGGVPVPDEDHGKPA